ncbi:MAG: ATP-binding protein, partial [Candidatus Binataceae bacterium]
EWTSVIPNARLCKALIDRITDRATIIETGTESYRFRRTSKNARNPDYRAAPASRRRRIQVI